MHYALQSADVYSYTWGIWCQKQIYTAWTINNIQQYSVGCNYLSMPQIHAYGAKGPICASLNLVVIDSNKDLVTYWQFIFGIKYTKLPSTKSPWIYGCTSLVPHLIGPRSLVPHLISPPSNWSPIALVSISLVPQLAPMYHPSHWSPSLLVPHLIDPPSNWPPSHWSLSHWSPN